MKNLKRYILTFAVFFIALPLFAFEYHNTTTKVNVFDYSEYTFTFTENGEEKTVHLTDEALTPAHQMALLREVYSNPNIPGIHYAYDYNGTQFRKIDYDDYAHRGQNDALYWVGSPDDHYDTPYQDGMTMLLVQVKNSWTTNQHSVATTPESYFNRAVKSIKLMTDFVRINDETNPGYMFTVDTSANRLFFISKGKPRSTYTKPFYRLYEQISPVNVFDENVHTKSFIDEMRAGNQFYCYHDCTNVFSMKTKNEVTKKDEPHWFTISMDGEAYDLHNLAIFVPDRRFEYELDSSDKSDIYINSSFYNEYGNSQNPGQEDYNVMPRVFLYGVTLNAEATISENSDDYFKVTLTWDTDRSGVSIPEHYWVYATDGTNMTLLSSIPNQPTTEKSHEFLVERLPDVQVMNFIVIAAPIIYNDNGEIYRDNNGNPVKKISATSNIASVTIPGRDPYFSQAAEYRSRYDMDSEINIYKNVLTISPTTNTDYESIKNNTDVFNISRTDSFGNKVVVASIRYVQKSDLSGYDYHVEYNYQSQDTIHLFDSEQPIINGSFSNYSESAVLVIDRFSASTASNSHSPEYVYRMEQVSGEYSNEVSIGVRKTTNITEGVGVTREEVDNDLDRTLQRGPFTSITFNVENNPFANILEYGVYAIDKNNAATKICKAENTMNDGVYNVYCISDDKTLDNKTDIIPIGNEGGTITTMDYNKSFNSSATYVPVIKTIYDSKSQEYNTYGCEKKQVKYPTVNIGVKKRNGQSMLMMTKPFGKNEDIYRVYVAEIYITPTLTNDINTIYYYRVWRVNGNKDDGAFTNLDNETILNDLESESGQSIDDNGNTVDWASDYTEIQNVYPNKGQIVFTDLYTDKAIVANTDEKSVKYIVRMYSTSLNRDASDEQYFIAQNQCTAKYTTTGTVTSVEEISSDNNIDITYYNILGMPSNTPYQGLNIIVCKKNGNIISTQKVALRNN